MIKFLFKNNTNLYLNSLTSLKAPGFAGPFVRHPGRNPRLPKHLKTDLAAPYPRAIRAPNPRQLVRGANKSVAFDI